MIPGSKQQSALVSNSDPQLSTPHSRPPIQSPSTSQSPSPAAHGSSTVQQSPS